MTAPMHPAYWDVHAKLGDPTFALAAALAQWEVRPDGEPAPDARRAANTAMDAIDAMLAALHGIRSRLVTEVRQADDAAAVRADALLSMGPPGYLAGVRVRRVAP